jgi:hypothetical protein
MESHTSSELFALADQLRSQAADPQSADDPKWLSRRADRLTVLAKAKEKALEHKEHNSNSLRQDGLQDGQLFNIAGGQILVWLDDSGSVCIKTAEPHGDPVELAEHEALELAHLLTRLAAPI